MARSLSVRVGSAPVFPSSNRFATSISANGRNILDQYGAPWMFQGDIVYSFPVRAGQWGEAATPAAVFEAWAVQRSGSGYNTLLISALGNSMNGGPFDNGNTWDGVAPFSGGLGSLNNTYWTRIDSLLTSMENHGITVLFNIYDSYVANSTLGVLGTMTSTQATTYGTNLGNRYKTRPNIIWTYGADYFGEADTNMLACHNAIRATGDTHLMTVDYMAESTSRKTSEGNATSSFGVNNTQFEFVYQYSPSYCLNEIGWNTTAAKPVAFLDGQFENAAGERKLFQDILGWSLTTGSQGYCYGAESTWAWPNGSLAFLSTEVWANNDFPAIINYVKALPGWYNLIPDFSSAFITSGRGTKASPFASGGNGGQYHGSPQDTYLTGAVTTDKTLAVIYSPVSHTFTIDQTKMNAGYTAKWVDPTNAAETTATPGSSYTTPGNNAAGTANWYLVLRG